METNLKTIDVIVPIYNEEEVLPYFISRLESVLLQLREANSIQVIFINDGSNDGTKKILEEYQESTDFRVSVISLSRNFGHQAALLCGYEHSESDFVICIDSDLQDPPELISNLILEIEKGFDIVLTKRSVRKGESKFKLFTAKIFYKILSRLSSTELFVESADFRLVSRRAVNAFLLLRETDPYIRGIFSWIGFPTSVIEYERDPRFAGKTKYTFRKMLLLARDALLSFSGNPMRLPFYLSFVFMIIGIVVSAYIAVQKIINPAQSLPGYASLMIVFLLAFSIQLLILGLIGEYLFRSMSYVQNRPRYIVMDKNEN